MKRPGDHLAAILPAKPFLEAKGRLAPQLQPAQRASLARRLLTQTILTVRDTRPVTSVLVVSSDPEALAIAAGLKVEAIKEPGPGGLNEALTAAAAHAESAGADAILVVATDLPLLTSRDLEEFMAASEGSEVTLAADLRGDGTNALLLRPPGAIEFAFGPGSLQRHENLAKASHRASAVCSILGLALDLDLPEDLLLLSERGWNLTEAEIAV